MISQAFFVLVVDGQKVMKEAKAALLRAVLLTQYTIIFLPGG